MEIKGGMERAQTYVGDSVFLKQEKKSKFSALFESIPYPVISRNHSRVTAIKEDGKSITRNVSFLRNRRQQ